jgi:hypothetical protein
MRFDPQKGAMRFTPHIILRFTGPISPVQKLGQDPSLAEKLKFPPETTSTPGTMQSSDQASRPFFQTRLDDLKKVAERYAADLDAILFFMHSMKERRCFLRGMLKVAAIQAKLDHVNHYITLNREHLTRLDQCIIDDFYGRCILCHKPGHKVDVCSLNSRKK